MSVRNWIAGGAALAIALCAVSAGAADDDVVARMDGKDIKASEFKSMFDELEPALKERMTTDSQVLLNVVRAELGRRAVLEEAQKRNWDKRPEVEKLIKQASQQVVLTSFLASVATVPEDYPSDADIKAAYDQNRDRFLVPRRFHLLDIFIASAGNEKGDGEARTKAGDLARKARARGSDFGELAKANSDERVSAARGGDLGWIPQNNLQPEVLDAIKGLADGEVTDPIHVAAGWHVFKLLETKAAGPRPMSEVRETLANSLRQQRATQLQQQYVEQQLGSRHAAVNEIALHKLVEEKK